MTIIRSATGITAILDTVVLDIAAVMAALIGEQEKVNAIGAVIFGILLALSFWYIIFEAIAFVFQKGE